MLRPRYVIVLSADLTSLKKMQEPTTTILFLIVLLFILLFILRLLFSVVGEFQGASSNSFERKNGWELC